MKGWLDFALGRDHVRMKVVDHDERRPMKPHPGFGFWTDAIGQE